MQKNQLLKYLSFLSCLIGFTINTFADDRKVDPSTITHSYSFSIEAMRYFYKEPNITQNKFVPEYGAVWMTDTGNLYGFNGSYRITWKDTLFIQPEGRFLQGKNSYRTGRKDKINGKTKNKIDVVLYEPRLIAGGIIPLTKKISLSPYTGIGYRFKSDDGEEVKYIDLRPNIRRSPKMLGCYRKSNYVYVPLGASAEYVINDSWSLSLKSEYDWIVKAWQYTRRTPNTDPSGKGYSINYKQPNGYGLKGEMSVSYLYNKVKFYLTPYVNYWNIRNSIRPEGRGREPYNITWETGLKLGISF
jgi:hypothetical protein